MLTVAVKSESDSETEEAPMLNLNIPRPVLRRNLRIDSVMPIQNLSYAGAAKKDYVHAITPPSLPTTQSTFAAARSSWGDYPDEESDDENEWTNCGNQTGFDPSGIKMEW